MRGRIVAAPLVITTARYRDVRGVVRIIGVSRNRQRWIDCRQQSTHDLRHNPPAGLLWLPPCVTTRN